LNSPRVRNEECKNFFAFAYFGTMVVNEILNADPIAEMAEGKVDEKTQPFRSSVANRI
jgi:hypothetical protein